jgi:hypothetical protein
MESSLIVVKMSSRRVLVQYTMILLHKMGRDPFVQIALQENSQSSHPFLPSQISFLTRPSQCHHHEPRQHR